MKALSIRQPWASFIAIGKKTIETRTWPTNYRGKLVIVSSKKFDENFPNYKYFLKLGLKFGQALAIANLVDCRPMRIEDEKAAMCSYHLGTYAWILSGIKKIESFPVKGKLGLYEIDIKEEK